MIFCLLVPSLHALNGTQPNGIGIAAGGQDCQPSTDWKGAQGVGSCASTCSGYSYFVVTNTDGNCKCCTAPSGPGGLDPNPALDVYQRMILFKGATDCQPSTDWKGAQDAVACAAACSGHNYFAQASDGNCKCCTAASGPGSLISQPDISIYTRSGSPSAPSPSPPSPSPPPGPAGKVYQFNSIGCNAGGAMHQIPGAMDYFVGRLTMSESTPGTRDPPPGSFDCSGTQQQLGLVKVTDWNTLEFKFIKTLLGL